MSLQEFLSTEEYQSLEAIAYNKTNTFCYSCYKRVEQSHCQTCLSDDLMLELPGVGVEYGTLWIIEHLISENCAPVDPDFAEESLRDCYSESVKVGWIDVDPIDAIKTLDPVSYRIAVDEYMDGFREDGEIIEVDGVDYWKDDILRFIEDNKLFEEVA